MLGLAGHFFEIVTSDMHYLCYRINIRFRFIIPGVFSTVESRVYNREGGRVSYRCTSLWYYVITLYVVHDLCTCN